MRDASKLQRRIEFASSVPSSKMFTQEIWEDDFCPEVNVCDRAKEEIYFSKYCTSCGKGCEYILVGHNWRNCQGE